MKEWREISRIVCFEKYGRKIEKIVFEMPDGTISDYYIKGVPPAVVTLALTPQKEIILVQEFRPGPMKTLFEMPGGYIGSNENTVEAGRRELLEETGYVSSDFTIVTDCFTDAYSTLTRTVTIALNCTFVGKPASTEEEFTTVRKFSLRDFRKILISGKMTDVDAGYIALDHLNLL